MRLRFLALLLTVTLASAPAWADVVLPSIISDHMVLQKTPKARIWGKAAPGEEVSVTLDKLTARATAGPDGKWALLLNLSESKPGPFELVVQGKNRIAVADVVVGEVWVASGQSNMAFGMYDEISSKEEIPASVNPMLRQFCVLSQVSAKPMDDCKGQWIVAGPKSTANFTAVGYYFGKRLQQELRVPVGLIKASWGGTIVEGWTSAGAIDTVPELKTARERAEKTYQEYPALKEAYVARFGQWLAENQREDRPCADAAAYAAPGISTEGWSKVNLPGSLQSVGLPATGTLWLRKEVLIPAADARKPFRLEWGPEQGFETVYWNGQPIQSLTYKDWQGIDQYRAYTIPAEQVKEGGNLLAVRIYAPVAMPKALDRINQKIQGEWLGKAEFAFPPLDAQQAARAPVPPLAQRPPQDLPGSLFNGMIAPITPYTIRGVIWYQGEFNCPRAWQYRIAFPLLINDWRAQWNQGDIPFYFCQLPAFNCKIPQPGESPWAELRESQAMTLKLPNTGQAVLIDTGEAGDIHPRDKRPAGERLAAIALARDYGKKIPHQSPAYESMKVENSKVRIEFAHVEGGLVAHPVLVTYVVKSSSGETAPLVRNSPQSELEGFAICGEDKKWVWADAKIDGDGVVVWSSQVPAPVAVRYAWAANPACNLYNQAGFPASPFRTDDFPVSTQNAK